MRSIIIKIIVISILMTSFLSCAQDMGGNEKGGTEIITDDVSTLSGWESLMATDVPDEYVMPEKMDEEMAKDFARSELFTYSIDNPNKLEWDELQVRLYPFYDIYGIHKSYLAVIYLGKEEMPDDETIKADIMKGYEAAMKYHEIRNKGEIVSDDIKRTKKLLAGKNPDTDEIMYISMIFSEKTSGDFVTTGGVMCGLPYLLIDEPSTIQAIEEYTGKTAKVTGYFGCRLTGYGFEILSGNEYYYVRGHSHEWIIKTKIEREEMFDIALEKHKQSDDTWEHSVDYFRRVLYLIETNPEIIDGTFVDLTND